MKIVHRVMRFQRLPASQKFLNTLKKSKDWKRPVSNVDAILWHLKDGELFKEFRSGDVKMEDWTYPDRLERMTKQVLEFLYY